jgi:hypothetical protein
VVIAETDDGKQATHVTILCLLSNFRFNPRANDYGLAVDPAYEGKFLQLERGRRRVHDAMVGDCHVPTGFRRLAGVRLRAKSA